MPVFEIDNRIGSFSSLFCYAKKLTVSYITS